jgi:meiotically up-regulated gene 157 (Mug157) protein
MLNTLKTTVVYNTTDAFIITGDIDAMWLRDSMNQLHPFVEFVNNDTKIDWLVRRIIARQASQIRADPYANAFQFEVMTSSEHAQDSSRRFLFEAVPFSAIFDISIVF